MKVTKKRVQLGLNTARSNENARLTCSYQRSYILHLYLLHIDNSKKFNNMLCQ